MRDFVVAAMFCIVLTILANIAGHLIDDSTFFWDEPHQSPITSGVWAGWIAGLIYRQLESRGWF